MVQLVLPTFILLITLNLRAESVPLWEQAHSDGARWTYHVKEKLEELGTNLLNVNPADSEEFCPNYQNLNLEERKDVWAFFISAMAKYESNFNPKNFYQENFKDSRGEYIVSRGLLQISFESGNAYKCAFRTDRHIHNPYKNLSCGIRILDRWMMRDGRMAGKVDGRWRGGARYWAVLRTTSKSYKKIVNLVRSHELCQ